MECEHSAEVEHVETECVDAVEWDYAFKADGSPFRPSLQIQ